MLTDFPPKMPEFPKCGGNDICLYIRHTMHLWSMYRKGCLESFTNSASVDKCDRVLHKNEEVSPFILEHRKDLSTKSAKHNFMLPRFRIELHSTVGPRWSSKKDPRWSVGGDAIWGLYQCVNFQTYNKLYAYPFKTFHTTKIFVWIDLLYWQIN